MGMLQCLDREHRMAYILGKIMEMQGPEAAEIQEISPELFRKRLQVARTTMLRFMKSYCGLASDEAPCRCNRQIPAAQQAAKISGESCNYATTPVSFAQSRAMLWCGRWKRRGGFCRYTAPITRALHPSTLPGNC
jgi:hypothetical protein